MRVKISQIFLSFQISFMDEKGLLQPSNEKLITHPIEKEITQSYIDYAMSVIVSRALPDTRDGFKPVLRRILFGMYQMNNFYNQKHKKSARIVGDVM